VADRQRRLGYDFVHAAVNDHSRLAYVEVHADERSATTAAFLTRAGAFFASHGMGIEQVMTDNALVLSALHPVPSGLGRTRCQTRADPAPTTPR
jgi:hypothetical protein